jgi:hypothetical protein
METRRFDELTVALARGGSRRGVLRSLAGGVLGALALGQSGALAKNDKDKSEKAEAKPEQPEQGGGNPEQGGGRPIISPARPICHAKTDYKNCPLCYEARFGKKPDGTPLDTSADPDEDLTGGCCLDNGTEKDCSGCNYENKAYCSASSGLNNGRGTCVTVTCTKEQDGRLHCDYRGNNVLCEAVIPGSTCCGVFTSNYFGHCVTDPETTCPPNIR